jgi:hypothetical protein
MIDLHLTNKSKSVQILSKSVKLFQQNRIQGGQKPQGFCHERAMASPKAS